MQRIFSSAARYVRREKDRNWVGELKIYWTKPQAGCRLWVLYGEREFQVGRTERM
jgi:hypothetical protein